MKVCMPTIYQSDQSDKYSADSVYDKYVTLFYSV